RLAAAQGHTDSQIRLGRIYEHGQGVPQDDMLAYMWFDIAAKQGREESMAYKNVIAARINPELIPEAEGLVEAWLLENR
ncbi:MAG: sel1 repeat family protein, partial [Desulfobacterales bacterium]|nr:sel1 repeat family protein [Desulfobacterales bacterium]